MTERLRPVVACSDGTPHSMGAVAWAARTARIHRLPLSIVHVVDMAASEMEITFAAATLREQVALAAINETSVPIGAEIIRGHVIDELIHRSRTARYLVLGINRDKTRPSHGILGPVEDRLVTHSSCPVVIVPTRLASPTPPPRVVVGWTPGSTPAETALTVAALEAHRRQAELQIVALHEPAAMAHPRLQQLRHDFNKMAISVASTNDYPAQVLAEHARGAELLVVGCHHDNNPWAIDIGPIPLELSRTTPCPLILTPPGSLMLQTRRNTTQEQVETFSGSEGIS